VTVQSKPISRQQARENRLLAALPAAALDKFCEHLEPYELTHGRRLYEADEPITMVVFPLTGAVSLIAETPDGDTVDTRLVGHDGFVGLPVFLGTGQMPMRAMCQVSGHALAMDAQDFRGLLAEDRVREVFQYYTQMAMVELSQTLLCNRAHTTTRRTARWLLELSDKVGEVDFHLTQEFFAIMLGVTRPQITTTVGSLRDAGLVDYSRGWIQITDRDGLEATACACYVIVRRELERLLVAEQPND
jgi:CRP-like cAMP-binding protein